MKPAGVAFWHALTPGQSVGRGKGATTSTIVSELRSETVVAASSLATLRSCGQMLPANLILRLWRRCD
jgi:hypothetical protein